MRRRTMKPSLAPRIGKGLGVSLETNGNGYLGFVVELPGAFVRGRTKQEALAKVAHEVRSYLQWLGARPRKADFAARIVQEHRCSLMVDDADSEILVDADRGRVSKKEFAWLEALALYSGRTLARVFEEAKFKDWVDDSRARSTFYGQNPRTIREIFRHVNGTQWYYISRTGTRFVEDGELGFMGIRRFCLRRIGELYARGNNLSVYDVDNELWTLKKLLRRFVWHDRIHAKAMMRILRKQKDLGMIYGYEDPFCIGGG